MAVVGGTSILLVVVVLVPRFSSALTPCVVVLGNVVPDVVGIV